MDKAGESVATQDYMLAIIPGLWGKVGGLLHRSRQNATFSAIIPEFCSVFQGVLQ
jgi:hypothetical protein